ncbi:hypothetical protein MBLNU13_g05552t1 [Cladosporium sp. NU13]
MAPASISGQWDQSQSSRETAHDSMIISSDSSGNLESAFLTLETILRHLAEDPEVSADYPVSRVFGAINGFSEAPIGRLSKKQAGIRDRTRIHAVYQVAGDTFRETLGESVVATIAVKIQLREYNAYGHHSARWLNTPGT